MPRKNRFHYKNAIYHVMLRGNNRQKIFHQHQDYADFLNYIETAAQRYTASILLYCLMTNHIHLVIEVTNIPISKIMQSVTSAYAKSHNKCHNKIGHVFQGRFLSKLVQDDSYLLELCYYIHMNPLKAKMCQSLDDYEWSSHHVYSMQQPCSFIDKQHILHILINLGLSYDDFIKQNRNIEPSYCALNEVGELDIKHSVVTKNLNRPILSIRNFSIHRIIKVVCEFFNITEDDACQSHSRKAALARSMIAYYAHYHANYPLNDIAKYFCMLTNSLSATLHRHLQQSNENVMIRKALDALEYKLSTTDVDNSAV